MMTSLAFTLALFALMPLAMTIERTKGKLAPRTPRPGEHAVSAESALAAPMRDPKTGRWVTGNGGHRLRVLRRASRQLVGLNPATCVAWLRPFVELAQGDMSAIVEEYCVVNDTALSRLAEDAASAHAVYRGLLALGAQGDREALAEARQWLREHRQSVLALRGEARAGLGKGRSATPPGTLPAWRALMADETTEPTMEAP